jgi:CRP-like cAMP-binding protein
VFVEVDRLSDGHAFGELALLKTKQRAATITCLTDVHVATLSKARYVEILGKLEEQKINDRILILSQLPIFLTWTRTSVERLLFYFEERKLQRN